MRQMNALLTLIEDHDPIVHEQVLMKFKTLGMPGRDIIMNYMFESQSEHIVDASDHLLGELADYYLDEQIRIYQESQELVEFFYLVSISFNRNINKVLYSQFFHELVDECQKSVTPSMTYRQQLMHVSNVLFRVFQFRNIQFEINNPSYILLDTVISNLKGETLSLCIIYYFAAKSIGLEPHFYFFNDFAMLRVKDVYIDLSGNGNLLSKEECKLLLDINYIKFSSGKEYDIPQVFQFYINRLLVTLNGEHNVHIKDHLEHIKEELF